VWSIHVSTANTTFSRARDTPRAFWCTKSRNSRATDSANGIPLGISRIRAANAVRNDGDYRKTLASRIDFCPSNPFVSRSRHSRDKVTGDSMPIRDLFFMLK